MTKTLAAIGVALLSLAAAGAFAQMPEPAKVADTSKGKALVDGHLAAEAEFLTMEIASAEMRF